jgi:hypothetical protein
MTVGPAAATLMDEFVLTLLWDARPERLQRGRHTLRRKAERACFELHMTSILRTRLQRLTTNFEVLQNERIEDLDNFRNWTRHRRLPGTTADKQC